MKKVKNKTILRSIVLLIILVVIFNVVHRKYTVNKKEKKNDIETRSKKLDNEIKYNDIFDLEDNEVNGVSVINIIKEHAKDTFIIVETKKATKYYSGCNNSNYKIKRWTSNSIKLTKFPQYSSTTYLKEYSVADSNSEGYIDVVSKFKVYIGFDTDNNLRAIYFKEQ